MKKIQTVIFDVSGVLLDDLYPVWKADSEAYEACGFGKIESIEKFKETFKLPIFEYHKSMGVPADVIPTLERRYLKAYPKYNNLIKIFPEIKDVLLKLKKENIGLAIASNIPRIFLIEHLQRFRIFEYFEVVTSQNDSEEQKPSPKPILVTLERLGSKPKNSAYIGDMEEDIIAGKRANVYTFAICRDEGYHPCWKLKRQNPDYFITNLNEFVEILQELNISEK
jgi:HAD superfamily hydrolase (TIGR01549 family)